MTYGSFVGRTERHADTVRTLALDGLAASLDVARPADWEMPPLWHWMLFQTWAPASGLGPDGHPKRGGFLPPVHDLPRRMWAGGRLRFPGVLREGDPVTRTSTILDVTEKTGGSGRLVFVTVRHEIAGPGGVAIVEEQDIVYRGAEGKAVKAAAAAAPAPEAAWRASVNPGAVLLFRYSALTGNGHRIHYDLEYVTQEEGYPGLVVHGPLQATLMAELVRRHLPERRIAGFSFRGRRPAFHRDRLTVEGWAEGETVRLRTLDAEGAVCMTAEAALAAE